MSSGLSLCPLTVDDSFGPWAEQCRGGFDFTLLFEESILTLPVLCIFIVALPFRLAQLARSDQKVTKSPLRLYKLLASISLAALQLTLLILWAVTSSTTITHTRATIPTAALTFIVAIAFSLLSWYEHARSVRPSFILTIYLFLSILLDNARTRTLWMLSEHRAIPIVFTCTMVLRCVLVILESTEKRNILIQPYKEYPKESTSGTFNRSVFYWLSSLFINGYKNVLSLGDLFPLDKNLYSEKLQSEFQSAWDSVSNKKHDNALMNTWLRVQFWPLMAAVFPRLCLMGFTFAQPFLVTKAVNLAAAPSTQVYNNIGYGLIGAYLLVYVGIGISTGQYELKMYRAAIMMRGSIVPCIFNKTLRLDSSDASPAAALTLVSTDIETMTQGIVQLHELWASFVEIGLATYLLQRQVGAACGVSVGFSFLIMMITVVMAVFTGKSQAAWILASQQRVAITSDTLGSIKWLKLSGLNDIAFSVIKKLRVRELDVSRRFRILLLGALVLSVCTPVMSPVLTFITFAGLSLRNNDTLTISVAFTSLSLFSLLNKPLTNIIIAFPTVAGCVASFGRVQEYLTVKERQDRRINHAISMEKANLVSSSRNPFSADDIEMTDVNRTGERGGEDMDRQFIVSMKGTFSWPEATTPVIDIAKWNIRRKTLTMLLGPVGCGKTTLLKCLLGELSAFEGTLHTFYVGVAYCDQVPWLPNESVRNVIAIARAVYSRKEFIVFDDVFSGLDSTTEDVVFHNLLGREGLLRNAEMTIVFASSDARRAPYVDYIVVLDDAGKMVEQGTFEEVNSRHGYISGLALDQANWGRDDKVNAVLDAVSSPESVEVLLPKHETPADSARQMGDSAVYKYYIKSAGGVAIVIFIISMAVFAFCDSFPNLWLKWWAEANVKKPNADLGKWLSVYAALGIGAIIGLLIGTWELFIVIITRSGIYFHSILIKTVSKAPMSLFSAVDAGVTINRFSQDLQLIDMELPTAAIGVALSLAFAIAQAILMSVASKYIAVIFPFVLGVFYIIQRFYLRTSRQMRFLDIEYKAPLYSQLLETLSGLSTIRAFHWENDTTKKNWNILDDSQRPNYLLYCLQRWLILSVDLVIALMALILITITVTLREQIGPGYMGIALVNIMGFSATIKAAIASWVSLEISIGAVARIKNFVAEIQPEGSSDGPLQKLEKNWPSEGAIEIRNLSASYPSSGTVLQNISLSIKAGQKIGICGRTGSGKSSLALCLFRMIDVDKGSIAVDDVELSSLEHEYVRTSLVAVPQEAYLFDGTVRLNVDPTECAGEKDIIQVLERVRLWPVVQRRGGLDVVIDSQFFSHGQKQLLSLARAMLRKSRVLVLDEVTSSLDDDTSAIVEDVVSSWFKDWTVIAIAHKLDSIINFDLVVVLDAGKVIELDDPKVLVSRPSVFKELYDYSRTGASKKMLQRRAAMAHRRQTAEMPPSSATGSDLT